MERLRFYSGWVLYIQLLTTRYRPLVLQSHENAKNFKAVADDLAQLRSSNSR